MIEHLGPSTDIFRAVAENAVQLSGSGSTSNDLLDELCSNESLARVSRFNVICPLRAESCLLHCL